MNNDINSTCSCSSVGTITWKSGIFLGISLGANVLVNRLSRAICRSFQQPAVGEAKTEGDSNTFPLLKVPHPLEKVTVRVPATTANMGSGFDTIGMALDIWSEIHVEKSEMFSITCVNGECDQNVPLDESNLVCRAVKEIYEKAGIPMPPLKYALVNNIPFARGLGSSSAAIIGGLLVGVALTGYNMDSTYHNRMEELLDIAATIEGHPDNVAPALYGGIRIGIYSNGHWMTQAVHLPSNFACVCFIPDEIGTTAAARAVLHDEIPRKDAVFNIGRVAWLVNCLTTENFSSLKYGVEDALHQSQRANSVYPYFHAISAAATFAGADGVYLSGAGPTIIALIHNFSGNSGNVSSHASIQQVSQSMSAKAKELGAEGKILVTMPSRQGAQIVSNSI